MIGILGDRYRYGCHLGFCGVGAETLAQFQMFNPFQKMKICVMELAGC
jgi:hypothetical protein